MPALKKETSDAGTSSDHANGRGTTGARAARGPSTAEDDKLSAKGKKVKAQIEP